ncbi:DNA methylase N-4/N-6 domain protein [uncultured Paludibacter sp.]|uniref:Methyltransferase n=1 Tax=uncultured Paludibacter sp. TaxID=497635 RepID=A0A653ACQ4_9BACT|nr:DNA methylase N-4/N-6 domain protein [uncultured Paludibacter sp.]
MNKKIRAPRNKTITLTDEERIFFEKNLFIPKKKELDEREILNKIILGDTLQVIDLLPDEFADLIIIDPPYNLRKDFHGFTFKSSDEQNYLQYLRSWFPQVAKKLKPNGSAYLCGDWKCTAALQTVMNEHLTVINRITWQREKGRGAKKNWKNGMEDIWFGVKNPKEYYFDVEAVKIKRRVIAPYKIDGKPKDWEETEDGNFRMTYPSNFWDDISVPYWSMPENTDHPTQKPEKLIAKLILASCPQNGIVFDPFLGSGTSAVTAKKLGRNYVGIEMNKEYALWAEKRIQNAEFSGSIQGYDEGVFWERNSGK